MKPALLSILFLLAFFRNHAQTAAVIHTSNQYILGPCNDTLRLKGVNYAPYNWGYSINELHIAEIAKTGANTVRLPWYQNNAAPVYSNYVALDSAISKCVQHDLIAIVELHDFTCANNTSALVSGSAWWTSNSVLPILNKYRHSVIVNIANEALHVNWASNPSAALSTYKTTYQTIITNLRNVAGFDFPLMIDAPDCGQHADAFITGNTAADLISFDPRHNLIFSAHAYWYGYANNDSTQMAGKLNNILAQPIPFVLGEIANQQDDVSMCQYNLNYKALLRYCETKKMSWLAWSWDHDGCPNRQLSTNGSFASLSTYGTDIVNNPTYGLSTKPAAKSRYLLNNSLCNLSTSISSINEARYQLAINSDGSFTVIPRAKVIHVTGYDLTGRKVPVICTGENTWKIEACQGLYLISIDDGTQQQILKLMPR